jgi:hypothetical protein
MFRMRLLFVNSTAEGLIALKGNWRIAEGDRIKPRED